MLRIMYRFAELLSERSSCSRLKVGCVITDENMYYVYGIGYNGGAAGQNNACESDEPGKCGHLHAEINAILKDKIKDTNKRMFVTTMPCKMCAKAIVNARDIKYVHYDKEYRSEECVDIFRNAGIGLYRIDMHDKYTWEL